VPASHPHHGIAVCLWTVRAKGFTRFRLLSHHLQMGPVESGSQLRRPLNLKILVTAFVEGSPHGPDRAIVGQPGHQHIRSRVGMQAGHSRDQAMGGRVVDAIVANQDAFSLCVISAWAHFRAHPHVGNRVLDVLNGANHQ
jgi:hypothetical protein